MKTFNACFFAAAALLVACSPAPASKAPPLTPAQVLGAPVVVTTPLSGARVTSPMVATGTATGWYFEGSFPAKLVGADGAVIAEAPAQAQGDWTAGAAIPFHAALVFHVTHDTPATLVLEQDMPGDNELPQQVSIPVTLATH